MHQKISQCLSLQPPASSHMGALSGFGLDRTHEERCTWINAITEPERLDPTYFSNSEFTGWCECAFRNLLQQWTRLNYIDVGTETWHSKECIPYPKTAISYSLEGYRRLFLLSLVLTIPSSRGRSSIPTCINLCFLKNQVLPSAYCLRKFDWCLQQLGFTDTLYPMYRLPLSRILPKSQRVPCNCLRYI